MGLGLRKEGRVYMDRMPRHWKSPCLFLWYVYFQPLSKSDISPSPHTKRHSLVTHYSCPFCKGSVCVFTSSHYTHLISLLICCRLAFSFIVVLILVLQVFHIINTEYIQGNLLHVCFKRAPASFIQGCSQNPWESRFPYHSLLILMWMSP